MDKEALFVRHSVEYNVLRFLCYLKLNKCAHSILCNYFPNSSMFINLSVFNIHKIYKLDI